LIGSETVMGGTKMGSRMSLELCTLLKLHFELLGCSNFCAIHVQNFEPEDTACLDVWLLRQ